ncbi:MAG: dihydrolipoamide acetyltransferase family protein [Actinomycetia bacterium]|nr:dihydrolipoamide acetyltransferase family protein [Actinomycetes bacterium]
MAQVVVMPQLGNSVESCLLTAWHVTLGDTVEPGTVLCDIETDKSTMDVPAQVSGTVLALLAAEGDDVPVKTPIVVVGEPGEPVPDLGAEPASQPETQPEPAAGSPAPAAAGTEIPAAAALAASPRARNRAHQAGVAVEAAAPGSGPHGRVITPDVERLVAAGPGLTSAAKGVPGYQPGGTGTGIGGRVTRADLAAAPLADEPAPVVEAAPATAPAAAASGEQVTELKGIRKLIADRMRESLAVSAQLSYDASAPAGALLALRKRLKATDPALGLNRVTIGDLVGLVAAKVVRQHPALNAHLSSGVLRSFDQVHLGMAVDTPRGLMVPTIRDAAAMGLRDFAAATKDLAAQCQSGRISPDLLAGATFTVSNLGSFGIESFTPIVNQPQTGILGVNAIVPRAVAGPDGSVGVEQRISFSLTADHQVVDGADAARFLRDLTSAIAAVDLFLMS